MASIGTSAVYSLLDFSYLYSRKLSCWRKITLTGAYARLVAQFVFVKLFGLRTKRARVLGITFNFDDFPTFAFLYREIFVKQEYLFDTDTLGETTPVIIDCGANIGLSVLYFKTMFPDARIVAFEPLPRNIALLRQNVRANRLHDVTIVDAAVGAKDGTLTFYYDTGASDNLRSSTIKGRGGSKAVRVKLQRLSTFIEKTKRTARDRPIVVKMDIEGAEVMVMEDLARTGALASVDMMMIEYHHNIGNGASLASFLGLLERAGFSYYVDAALSPRKGYQDVMIFAKKGALKAFSTTTSPGKNRKI